MYDKIILSIPDRKGAQTMKNIFLKNPENAVNYLAPQTPRRLLITMGIKLAFALAGMFAMPVGDYAGFARAFLMLMLLFFAYDICCLYQTCLHVAQSVLMSFLLFLVLLFALGLILQYTAPLFADLAPSTASGENILLGIMILILSIPFIIDIVRLTRLLRQQSRGRQRDC